MLCLERKKEKGLIRKIVQKKNKNKGKNKKYLYRSSREISTPKAGDLDETFDFIVCPNVLTIKDKDEQPTLT